MTRVNIDEDPCVRRTNVDVIQCAGNCTRGKELEMTTKEINEATVNLTKSWQETNKAIADNLVAAQERNLRFAQSVYENGAELLKSHADGARRLMETLVEQSHTQQEAFQTIARESMNAYVDFLYAPFSFYQQAVEAAQTITRQGVETAQRITRQSMDAAQDAARQAAEAAQAGSHQG